MVGTDLVQDMGLFNRDVAGCDEVGRGCLAGPVVAAAVVLPDQYDLPGLDDSKKLTAQERDLLGEQIRMQALAWSIGMATSAEVDTHNVLQATFLAMHRAIAKLCWRHPIRHLLIDGNRFKPYPGLQHTCVVQGDAKVASIAAASILAKTHRDDRMHCLGARYPWYGWQTNVGYPTVHHRRMIAQEGITPYHRISFKLC